MCAYCDEVEKLYNDISQYCDDEVAKYLSKELGADYEFMDFNIDRHNKDLIVRFMNKRSKD